jgi:hypothetical protein
MMGGVEDAPVPRLEKTSELASISRTTTRECVGPCENGEAVAVQANQHRKVVFDLRKHLALVALVCNGPFLNHAGPEEPYAQAYATPHANAPLLHHRSSNRPPTGGANAKHQRARAHCSALTTDSLLKRDALEGQDLVRLGDSRRSQQHTTALQSGRGSSAASAVDTLVMPTGGARKCQPFCPSM